jgi:hypothetical protein
MSIASRNGSGRVATIRLEGLTPAEISGQDLRVAVGRTLGWQHVRSAAFEMRRAGDAYRLSGRGYGHGVGMCVIGAANLATAGQTAKTILGRYYPGLEIGARPRGSPPSPRCALVRKPPGPPSATAAPGFCRVPAGRSIHGGRGRHRRLCRRAMKVSATCCALAASATVWQPRSASRHRRGDPCESIPR